MRGIAAAGLVLLAASWWTGPDARASESDRTEITRPSPAADRAAGLLPGETALRPGSGDQGTAPTRACTPMIRFSDDLDPASFAVDDFDEDGLPDLIRVRERGAGDELGLHPGRSPHATTTIDLTIRPDFLGAGDFDNDGHRDAAVAARGGDEIVLLLGDGRGGFGPPARLPLPGKVTAFAVGDVNRPDGLADLVVAIHGPRGSTLLVYESPDGAIHGEPEVVELPAPVTALALGQLDGRPEIDLAVAMEGDRLVVHGRDRRLSRDRRSRAAVPAPATSAVDPTLLDDVESDGPEVRLSGIDATFVVTHVGDSGAGSLRQAIADANANSGADAIEFDISGSPPHVVAPLSPLPDVTDTVTIDGRSQPGWSGDPAIVLDGSGAGAADGLVLAAGSAGSSIRDLAIHSFSGNGISIESAGNVVEGCFVGTDATGTSDLGNTGDGIVVNGASNLVGGTAADAANVVSGNGLAGIFVDTQGGLSEIQGNFVGTNAAGTADLGNDASGIISVASNVTIGGTTAGAGNLVSGNDAFGIGIGSDSNLVQGNRVGTNAAGTAAIANSLSGVHVIDGSSNTIGGTAANAGNLVSGNGQDGIYVLQDQAVATGNQIQGNLVGTDVSGGSALGNGDSGVFIQDAPGNLVGGSTASARNIVSGNDGIGILVLGSGADANDVQGNYVGTDSAGTAALGNVLSGVVVQGANNSQLGGTGAGEGNLISSNGQVGVFILDDLAAATGNRVEGNLIGTDETGASALGNTFSGVFVQAANNTIGGSATGSGNVISGNGEFGVVMISAAASGNQVEGNRIGTDSAAAASLGNALAGVIIQDASSNKVGGVASGSGNVISGNGQSGVFIVGDVGVSTGNSVRGNLIGTDGAGTTDLGNAFNGVSILDANDNTVGGVSAAARNVISGNDRNGVLVVDSGATANRIEGNFIGTDSAGSSGLGNAWAGVRLEDAVGNTVGGTSAGSGNVIAFNGHDGISAVEPSASAVDNEFLGNSIVGNGSLGIDLVDNGVTANDLADPDSGPNGLQNFPVLAGASVVGSTTDIQGTLNSLPGTGFRIELFSSPACDGSGSGEGETFLGFVDVTTNGSGDSPFSLIVPSALPAGEAITATATGPDGTSEFAACIQVSGCVPAVFPESIVASADKTRLEWTASMDVHYVRGNLAGVSSYSFFADGSLAGATSLNVSADSPGSSAGFYYLIREEPCGSWQTSGGAEPGREGPLP